MSTQIEIVREYTKCVQNPIHAIETYLQTFDLTQDGYVDFNLFQQQKDAINNYESERFNILLKYRQAGASTFTSAYLACKAAFADPKRPEKILIIANKLERAQEFLGSVVEFLKQLPNWVTITKSDGSFPKDTQKHIKLTNGSEIKAVASSKDALRGYVPTFMVLDEAAFIEGGSAFWSACLASISTGGKATLISTPNGLDEIYYAQYEGSIENKNTFKITEMKWYNDPRYNKDLKFIKTEDTIKWILTPEEERKDEIVGFDNTLLGDERIEKINNLLSQGYKPHSTWFEEMCREMNLNRRSIAQELECSFLGSGDNVIDTQIIIRQEKENCINPIRKEWSNDVWIWKEPEEGHRYVAGLDVSRGDSDDSTGFTIIDFDTWEQVLEYHGKMPPDFAASLLMKYGMDYKAFTCIDITGGMGVATARKLKELKYPDKLLFYDGLSPTAMFGGAPEEALPGINFSARNNRVQIVQAMEEAVRVGGFKIRSLRLTNELRKFVYVNGRPDHLKGAHDDCLKEGTLIKTINGYKPIEEIKIGDLVLTHKGRYMPVVDYIKKPFNGDWYDFNFANQLSIGLSYNHPIYGYNKKDDSFDWYFPNEWMLNKKGVEYSDCQHTPRQISIKEQLINELDFLLLETDYYTKSNNETNNKLSKIKVDKKFSKFLGLFLADGHAYKNSKQENNNNIYTCSLAFNTKQKNLINQMNDYLIINLGIKTNININGNSTVIKFSSKLLWYVLNDCYDDDRNKILPNFYKKMGQKLYYVLKYWLKGDGWINKRDKSVIGCSISNKLSLEMRDIAISLGYDAQIREVPRKRYNKETKKQYWVTIRKRKKTSHLQDINELYYGTKNVKIEKTNFKGDVYNLQVLEDESFIANGIVVHNCIMALGMALFVANTSFALLEKNTSQINAMAKSWKTYESTSQPIQEQNPAAVSNNSTKEHNMPYMPEANPYMQGQGKEAYRQFKWVFGIGPKEEEEYKKRFGG